jgi:glycosyltransferase involved in cell wall biosynthesis
LPATLICSVQFRHEKAGIEKKVVDNPSYGDQGKVRGECDTLSGTSTSGKFGHGLDVMHVIPSLGVGGAERVLATLVSAARDPPMRQIVVHFLADDMMGARIRDAGVPIERIPVDRAADAARATWQLSRLIRMRRPAVIQTWAYYADLLSLAALTLSGLRVSTRLYWGIRCSDLNLADYSAGLRWTVRACARLASGPDAVIANSDAGRAAHLRLGYVPRRFIVIPNGIDTVRFAPDPRARARLRHELALGAGAPVVAHVARVDPMKDHAALIAVAAALPETHFLAIGKGTEALQGPPNLHRLGVRDDIPELLAASDAMLSTSRYGEGFSNAIAEAMAVGLPVVATDVGDARLIVGEPRGIVAPGAVHAMAAELGRIMRMSDQERAAAALRGRRRIQESFSVEALVARFDALHRTDTLED